MADSVAGGLTTTRTTFVTAMRPLQGVLGMMGAGVDYQPTLRFWRGRLLNQSRWGVRIDARVYFGSTRSETFVDTRPSFVIGSPNVDVPD